jgi:pimeloyl-ACP methyl ester carboxylesterase
MKEERKGELEPVPKVQGIFNSRDGTTLYYEVFGEGKPLLFCYGLLCRREHWHHQLNHFAKKFQVIQFDYRGHQFSSRPQNDRHLTLDWCARDAQDLLDHLKIDSTIVLAHSMGVPVACHLLKMEPRVRGGIFICGTVTNPFKKMFHSNRMDYVYRASSLLYDLAPGVMNQIWAKFSENNRLNYFLTSRLGFNATRSEEQDVLRYMEGVNQTPYAVFNALMRDYTKFDGRKLLGDIEVPVLVIAGESDVITPMALQEEMAGLLKKGQLVRIPGGSHNAHTDYPRIVNQEIDVFLKGLQF